MTHTTPVLILFCSSSSWGGLEQMVVNLAKWMQEDGQPVQLICTKNTPIARHCESFMPVTYWPGHVHYFDLKAGYLLAKYVTKAGNVPLLVAHNKDMDVAAWAHRINKGRFDLWYWQHMQLGLSKKSFFQKLRHSRITGWLSPLPYLKNEAERCTVVQPHRIHVLAPGIELDRFMPKQEPKATLRQRLNLPREAFLMGILGRQDPLKGQDFALKALAKLPDDVHLVIMGAVSEDPIGAAYAQKLRTLKQELNLQKRVHFLPFDPDPSPFYQAIDLLLMTTQGETYGLVTVEALASKTPVLGNDSGGTPDLLDHGTFGYLYKPADKTDFCHKILHIKANPAEAMAKAALGFESVHQMLSKQAFLERFKNLVLR